MQSSIANTTEKRGTNPQATTPNFSKRIGSTTYMVSVYHSLTSKETAADKLLRLIENEVRNSA
jgi:hypothetical protein